MIKWTDTIVEGYEVSSNGEVRRKGAAEFLSQYPNSKGYMRVWLKGKHYAVHRLVALAFIPNPDNLETVDHINGNILDNKVENLQWLSRGDNIRKSRTGQKLNRITKKIMCLETGEIFDNSMAAEKKTNCYHGSILNVCKNKQASAIKRDTKERYHFKYID